MKNVLLNSSTLPDFIDYNLHCLAVGLNPSMLSAKHGYYFANPRNRFWSAFNQSGMIKETLTPSVESQCKLLDEYKIGFTDVVKRASRMGNELRADDFRQDAPRLREKVETYLPRLLWFHGKIAASKYCYYAYGYKDQLDWGWNDLSIIFPIKVYVTPNPSPANAKYSLSDLVAFYEKIKLAD